ncbi:MAG: metallophosphoesterase [Desulfuromonadales bacterium]|nr:metallophosphoesterase [Desulfuromonadales bacterium]
MSLSRRQRRGLSRRRFLTLGMTGAAAFLAADMAWYEPRALRVEEHQLPTPQPGGRVRIAQISDLHLSRFDDYCLKVIDRVTGQQPDLIVLTGDYLEEERNIRAVLDFLRELKAPHGIYAVQGNWEYWSRLEGENLRRHFAGAGVKLLIDERADLEVNGRALSLHGLDYPSSADALQRLQQGLDPARYNLLLSHVPAFAHEKLHERTDLVLCGHTHGGQVRIPAVPPFYLPRYAGRFVAGFYQVSQQRIPLYVSRGIGTSILPVRLLCRPEIGIFDIVTSSEPRQEAPA